MSDETTETTTEEPKAPPLPEGYQDHPQLKDLGALPTGPEQTDDEEESDEEETEEFEAAAEEGPPKDDLQTQVHKVNTALRQERASNRDLVQRLGRMEALLTRMEAREEPGEEEPELPDPNIDPALYAARKADQTAQKIDDLANRDEAERVEFAQEEAMNTAGEWIDTTVETFTEEHTDYPDAETHWMGVLAGEMEDQGATEQQIHQAVGVKMLQMAAVAQKRGTTVPEMIYAAAKRYGYSGSNGAAEGEEETEEPKPKTGKVAAARKRISKAKDLGQAAGTATRGGAAEGTYKLLAKMTQPEFDSAMDDLERKYGKEGAKAALRDGRV